MAMRLQYWVVFLLVVFVTAAATATLVGGDDVQPTIAEQAGANYEKVKNEAIPTISEKIEGVKGSAQELTQKEAEQVGEAVKTWKDWAYKSAGEWTGKGKKAFGDASESAKGSYTKSASSLHSSSVNAQKSASGAFSKWSKWAQESVGKYRPKKDPAAEAIEFINKKRGGSTDEEL